MKQRKRVIVIIGSLLILVLLGYMGVHYFNGPATGTVETPTTGSEDKKPTEDTSTTQITGTYVAFVIPAKFTAMPAESLRFPTVESFSYQYKPADGSTERISISVNDVSSNNGQSTSYQLRASKPDQYQNTTQTFSDQTFQIMTDTSTSQFSKVAYSTHGKYVADISLEGGTTAQAAAMQAQFETLLASWQWLQ